MSITILVTRLIVPWFIVNILLWLFVSMFRLLPFIGPTLNRWIRLGLTKTGAYMGLLACNFQNKEETIYLDGIEKLE